MEMRQIMEWASIIVGIPSVLALLAGVVKWFYSIHKIGSSIEGKMEEFLMQLSQQSREHGQTRKMVKKHERVLVEHGTRLDVHGTRLDVHGSKLTMIETPK